MTYAYDMQPEEVPEEAPPPRRGGCLRGCLIALLMILVGAAAVLGYGVWHVYSGYHDDARVRGIMDVVTGDPRAEAVLGTHIHILSIESHDWQSTTGLQNTATYTLHLEGTTAKGVLKARLDVSNGQNKIILLILTGPDGHAHTLVGQDPDNPFETL